MTIFCLMKKLLGTRDLFGMLEDKKSNLSSNLDHFPLPKKIHGDPLEEKIIPLVKAINSLGLVTVRSCEGHLYQSTPYPHVIFHSKPISRQFLYDLVTQYNQKNDIFWQVKEWMITTQRYATNLMELESLQQDIYSLAQFLFNNRKKR